MSVKNRKNHCKTQAGGVLLAAGMLTAQRALADSVFMSPPPVVTTPQVTQEDATNNDMNVFVPAGTVNPDSAGLFQYGFATVHPHVNYSVVYGSGIQSSISNRQDTVLQSLSPGLTVDLGRHWTVDYTPTINFYSSHQLQDGVDHSATLTGATGYGDWNFGLTQSFSDTTDPTYATGGQTSQQNYVTALTAGYAFNDKWTGSASVNQNLDFVSQLQNSYNWSTTEGVNYQFWPRLNAGVSLTGGFTRVVTTLAGTVNNPDIINEQLNFNVGWRATDKISLQASVGFEDQEFTDPDYQDSLNPIFSASIQYQPFAHTQISLTGSRTVSSSDYYIIAQSTEATTVSLSFSQRILVKYNLSLTASYGQTDYTIAVDTSSIPGIENNLSGARNDNNYSFNASFGRSFLTHGNWAITYQYADNESNLSGFAQRNNQIGFQIGFRY